MSTEEASPAPPSPQAVIMGMESTPSFSITPSIFGFLNRLDLQSLCLNPNIIPSIHLITGCKIVVYDPIVAESRLGGLEAE